jgi:hypothetical protein
MTSRFCTCGAVSLIAFLTGACGDGLGPGQVATLDVTIQQAIESSAPSVVGWYASVGGGDAVVLDKNDIALLEIVVTDIEFLPADKVDNANDDGVWLSLQLPAPVTLNLAALPAEGESPLVIGSGPAASGDYRDVRLFVSEASIVFTSDVDLGVTAQFAGNEQHDVIIPSGETTGIKTDVAFTVNEAQDAVNLLFDPNATYLNVTGTGSGDVILSPVIR